MRPEHPERHFASSDTVRDIVLGMADGLTVPFALAAGLSGAVNSTAIIVTAGLAEIAAGSIAMGLGGYLAARSDAEHYTRERAREGQEIEEKPAAEMFEVAAVLQSYGLTPAESAPVARALSNRPSAWIDFMMRFELGLEKPDPRRALTSALTIGAAYAVGGIIPLAPYIFLPNARTALIVSIIVTACALVVFGYAKARFSGADPVKSALQTLLVGSLAAAAAYSIARLIS